MSGVLLDGEAKAGATSLGGFVDGPTLRDEVTTTVVALMFPFLAAAVLVVALAGACTSRGFFGGYRDDLTTDEAMAHLQDVVKGTAEAAAPGRPHTVSSDVLFGGCEETDVSAHVESDWAIEIPIEEDQPDRLLAAVENYWEERGFEVNRDELDQPVPELSVSHDGFIFRAIVNPTSKHLFIVGTTPCVPNPELEED